MSAETWMFTELYPLPLEPNLRLQLWVQYVGPDRHDDNNPPSTCLSDIYPEYLDIWDVMALYPDEVSPDDKTDEYWEVLQAAARWYVTENSTEIIEHLRSISWLKPEWYWDT